MSLIKAIKAQLGLSVTPANNFTLDASADNGTMKLARNSGQDIMTVVADGTVAFPAGCALIPAGAMQMFFMNSAPSGWLAANGALVSRTTYATLFAAIGTTYGVGDGSTTFQLPDMRGLFPRSSGTNSNGVASGTFGAKQVQSTQDHTHYTLSSGNSFYAWLTSGGAYNAPAGGSLNIETIQYTGSSNSAGVSGQTETRPANLALLCCIKT